MARKIFSVPSTINHVFAICDPVCETQYYRDKDLLDMITEKTDGELPIEVELPNDLKKIEISKVFNNFDNSADTLNYFHLWPFPHMKYAEIVTDGNNYTRFPLLNDTMKCSFRESLEKTNWEDSILIVYEKDDKSKVGFLLFH